VYEKLESEVIINIFLPCSMFSVHGSLTAKIRIYLRFETYCISLISAQALESIPQEQQAEVVKELDGHVLKCVKDQVTKQAGSGDGMAYKMMNMT
jgi:uncharacterized metal-binding protein